MSDFKTYEYIWLDGYTPEANMRSKVKATDDDTPPDWSFDGSSTLQAEGGSSDCLLLPVQNYSNPHGHDLVMTQVQSADHTTHPTNFRAAAAEVVTDEWWFGFEQEFFFTDPKSGEPLGWEDGTPREQGEYYCGVGAGNVVGREISDAHLEACLDLGITLWVSRYLLFKIAEEFGVGVNIHPKPKTGDWNGSGMHSNFSNEEMRTKGSKELFESMCEKLGKVHADGIASYGSDNDMRLTGLHETQKITEFSYGVSDRGASIRIPVYTVEHDWNGYLEDRSPASNADPYKILAHIVGTLTK